jgi:hypothetical protein
MHSLRPCALAHDFATQMLELRAFLATANCCEHEEKIVVAGDVRSLGNLGDLTRRDLELLGVPIGAIRRLQKQAMQQEMLQRSSLAGVHSAPLESLGPGDKHRTTHFELPPDLEAAKAQLFIGMVDQFDAHKAVLQPSNGQMGRCVQLPTPSPNAVGNLTTVGSNHFPIMPPPIKTRRVDLCVSNVHGGKWQCPKCPKQLSSKDKMKKHMQSRSCKPTSAAVVSATARPVPLPTPLAASRLNATQPSQPNLVRPIAQHALPLQGQSFALGSDSSNSDSD